MKINSGNEITHMRTLTFPGNARQVADNQIEIEVRVNHVPAFAKEFLTFLEDEVGPVKAEYIVDEMTDKITTELILAKIKVK